jgi:hypothetical protein
MGLPSSTLTLTNLKNMKKNFELKFTGWLFIAAAILLWGGWAFSSHHIGEYVKASDFTIIGENVWYWIWMYRIHIFGWVTMALALFAFLTLIRQNSSRVMMLPGVGMTIIGTMTLAIAAAFYYNFGAWGVGETMNKSPEEVETFMSSILPTNQYVTCFIRFGRIFSGVGLVLMGASFLKWKILPSWLGAFTTLLGLAAVILILAIPDNFELYKPLFHLKALWIVAMGVIILTKGVNLSEQEEA